MERPIVTTDLSFARDICGDAALYYSPMSAADAADTIVRLAHTPELRSSLIEKGKRRLRHFLTPSRKHERLLQLIGQVATMRTRAATSLPPVNEQTKAA